MLVLADIGVLPADSRQTIADWVEGGGVLLRFAGPRLAGGHDDLVPVELRTGGRELGSALSWEAPQGIAVFAASSPFAGLAVDPDVKIRKQVLAEPSADLPERIWAGLDDGTPLITAAKRGRGLIVLCSRDREFRLVESPAFRFVRADAAAHSGFLARRWNFCDRRRDGEAAGLHSAAGAQRLRRDCRTCPSMPNRSPRRISTRPSHPSAIPPVSTSGPARHGLSMSPSRKRASNRSGRCAAR